MVPRVLVMMSTYNGEKYLVDQIDSILNQKYVNVDLLVRDDGSTDGTIDILKKFSQNKQLVFYKGKNLKTAKSFINLLNHLKNISYHYYAFSDQDDIWKEDKLIRAVEKIDQVELKNKFTPILYTSNYQLVDKDLNKLIDDDHVTSTNLGAAIAFSCATGCTEVFNEVLMKYARMHVPTSIIMHDDWIHKLCLCVGGEVIYDNFKGLLYRQHGNNVEGGIHSVKDKLIRIYTYTNSRKYVNSKQLSELNKYYRKYIPLRNKELIDNVLVLSKQGLRARLRLIFDKRYSTPKPSMKREFNLIQLLKCW